MPDSSTPSSFTIDFEPLGKRVSALPGETLLSASQKAGIELVALCGGTGLCGSCKVRLMSGDLNPLTRDEQDLLSAAELADGTRLACAAKVLGNVKIHIPPESLSTPQRLQVECAELSSAVEEPVVRLYEVRMDPPTLEDLRSDSARLKESLLPLAGHAVEIETGLLGELSNLLRLYEWRAGAVVYHNRLVALLPPSAHPLGIAVDLGTTKVAMYLLDLHTGATLAKKGMMNPQISYGEDVISRIAYTDANPDGRRTLQQRLVETLNQMTAELCAESGVESSQVAAAVVVGNTVMHHLFAGLPVKQLSLVPFVPAVSEPLELPAASLGWNLAPGAPVYLPANIAGYVGADHVSMALAIEIYQSKETMIALDIGTNTEISLVHNGVMRCCSCASGPAFEGAHIRHGMRAADGAIERIQIKDGRVVYHTIGNQPPVGICGSGILDAVAALRKASIISTSGAFQADAPGVSGTGGNKEYLLVDSAHSAAGREITIHRRDVNEIALAKAAIRTGIDLLIQAAGLEALDIQHFVIAGAFGTYLDIESAITIGMFPDLPRGRFRQVGNAAGLGAQMMLLSAARRAAAAEFAPRMEYIELTSQPDFKDVFIRSMYY